MSELSVQVRKDFPLAGRLRQVVPGLVVGLLERVDGVLQPADLLAQRGHRLVVLGKSGDMRRAARNEVATYMWHSLAVSGGHHASQADLRRLAAKMTAEQVAEAMQLAIEWREDQRRAGALGAADPHRKTPASFFAESARRE